jgi:ketopantoate hydroxymethyltransferase
LPSLECSARCRRRDHKSLSILTIGIVGTARPLIIGPHILGLLPGEAPSFATQYADLFSAASQAASQYAQDVREGRFPPVTQVKDNARSYGGGRREEQ